MSAAATLRRRADPSAAQRVPLLTPAGGSEHARLCALEALRARCAVEFDFEDELTYHVWSPPLQEIWAVAFPGEAFALPSERWKAIGFQGTDPTSDLRGAGFMSLVHLQRFLRGGNEAALRDAASQPDTVALPLSIASINVTAMLQTYLQLCPKLTCAFLPGGRLACSDDTLHAFLSLAESADASNGGADVWADTDDDRERRLQLAEAAARHLEVALQAMHERLLRRLIATWREMTARPTTTLMDFPVALRATHEHMQRALRSLGTERPWRLDAVTEALEREHASALPAGFGAEGLANFAECFGRSKAAASDLFVQPTSHALTVAYSFVTSVVLSLCCVSWFGGEEGRHAKSS